MNHAGKKVFSVKDTGPEILVCDPMPDGSLKLVAVEYAVPIEDWNGGDPASPPRLFGREFHVSPDGLDWILHAWAWKNNPAGMFEDWNPNVSCDPY